MWIFLKKKKVKLNIIHPKAKQDNVCIFPVLCQCCNEYIFKGNYANKKWDLIKQQKDFYFCEVWNTGAIHSWLKNIFVASGDHIWKCYTGIKDTSIFMAVLKM